MAQWTNKSIDPLENVRIGVATAYGRPYFRFAKMLGELGVRFESILPDEIPGWSGGVIFTTREEAPSGSCVPMLYEEICKEHATVVKGLILLEMELILGQDALVIGVDPGRKIGLSISYHGIEIESSTYQSAEGLVSHLIAVLAGLKAKRKVVKIGSGDMAVAREIGTMLNLRFCSSFELEFVDEHSTSHRTKNHNQRGKRDMLSARYIAQRRGRRLHVLPLSITG